MKANKNPGFCRGFCLKQIQTQWLVVVAGNADLADFLADLPLWPLPDCPDWSDFFL